MSEEERASRLNERLDQIQQSISELEALLRTQINRIYQLEQIVAKIAPMEAAKKELPAKVTEEKSKLHPPPSSAEKPTAPHAPQTSTELTAHPPSSQTIATPPAEGVTEDLETRIGGHWLQRIGMLAIFLGAAYFLKYAYDNRWIGEVGRTVIGLLTGIGFLGLGERTQRKGMPRYAQVLSGGGIGILYLSLFAAYQFYHLLNQTTTFFAMAVVTASSVVLSIHYDSIIIAILATLGGFLTPVLLSTGVDKQIPLFSYITFLDIAILLIALYKNWPALNFLSFVLTELMLFTWGQQFYADEKLTRTEFFLTEFFLIFSALVHLNYKRKEERATSAIKLGALNVLCYFIGSAYILVSHPAPFFVFLVLFSLALITGGALLGKNQIKLEAFLLVALAQLSWMADQYTPNTQGLLDKAVIYFTVLFLIYFLSGAREFIKRPTQTLPSELIIAFANAAVYFGSMYYLLDPKYHDYLGPLALALAGIYFSLGYRTYSLRDEARLNAFLLIGIGLTFLTIAIPIHLKQQWITLAWAVEAVVLTWTGFRADSLRVRQAAALVFLLVVIRLLLYEATPRFDESRIYPIFLNKRFAIFLVSIACFYLGAAILFSHRPRWDASEKDVFNMYLLTANLLTIGIVTMEIITYFDQRVSLISKPTPGMQSNDQIRTLLNSQRLLISLFWAVYSILGVIIGIYRRYRPLRILSMALFGAAIFKVFLFDTLMLEKIYRVLSLVSLGALLLIAAYLFQKYRAQINAMVTRDK